MDIQEAVPEQTPKPLSIRRNMLWNSAGSLIRLGCNWLMTILVVRLSHGFDAAGVLSLAMSIYNLMQPFAEYRLRTVQVTDVKNEYSAGEYLGMRTVTTVSALVLTIVYSIVTCSLSAIPPVILYVFGMFITVYTEGLRALEQKNLRMDYIGKSYALIGISNLASFSIVLFFSNSITLAISTIIIDNIIITFLFDVPKARQFESLKPIFNWKVIGQVLRTLLPVMLASVFANAVLTFPRQYLSTMYGAASLGIYASMAAPAVIIQAGATYLYEPLIGVFAKRLAEQKQAALKLFLRTLATVLVVSLVLMGLLQLFGRPLVSFLFGEDIVEYFYLLLPALICALITAISWFMNDLLISMRDYKGSFAGNLTAALLSLITFRPLIEMFSMNGVNYVGIVSCGTSVIVLALFFVRDYIHLQ